MSASMLKYLIAADSLCDGENGVSLTALALKAGVTKVSAYRAVDNGRIPVARKQKENRAY